MRTKILLLLGPFLAPMMAVSPPASAATLGQISEQPNVFVPGDTHQLSPLESTVPIDGDLTLTNLSPNFAVPSSGETQERLYKGNVVEKEFTPPVKEVPEPSNLFGLGIVTTTLVWVRRKCKQAT